MKIFDGNFHASLLDKHLDIVVQSMKFVPGLAIVQIGNNSASSKYVQIKQRYGNEHNIPVEVYCYEDSKPYWFLHDELSRICARSDIGGVIVQLPLPGNSHYKLLDLIPRDKDVDLLASESRNAYLSGDITLLSPVVRAFKYFYDHAAEQSSIISIGVVGDGGLVGAPIFTYLIHKKLTVDLITDYTPGEALDYDLLILGTGNALLVDPQDIKDDCHVVDFGTYFVDGKIIGDLNTYVNYDHLGIVSKTPGGMGPLVVRYLFYNLTKL